MSKRKKVPAPIITEAGILPEVSIVFRPRVDVGTWTNVGRGIYVLEDAKGRLARITIDTVKHSQGKTHD